MNRLREAFSRGLTPPPNLTVSQWADQFRMLSPEASAEPGRWCTDRAPFQRAIMDAITDPAVKAVVVMSSAQVGKTEILLNAIGYCIDLDPSPTLVIQPTLQMAEAFSKDRIEPMIRDTPVLSAKIQGGSRSASNTILHKSFVGGHLTLAGANSPAGLASRPIRRVFADEVDRWDVKVGDEGDPLALAHKRANNFWNRKFITVSTPGVKGISRIERLYQESDQRQFFLACPHCATRHTLKWQNVKWVNKDPETAHLVCPECGCIIDEAGRQAMLRDPEERPTAPFHGTAGFHLWEAYSPWRRLSDIVADFLASKDTPDTLQVFVNTTLGETWEVLPEQDHSVLLSRREPFEAEVPDGVLVLMMGVDTQDDRLEALVVGFGIGEESWIIDHRVIQGDPQNPEPWDELDELLAATYRHQSGALLSVSATCIDYSGHRSQYVNDFVLTRQIRHVYAIIGKDGANRPIVSAPSRKRTGTDRRKVNLYMVGVDACKSLVASRLHVTKKGPGYIHLPLAHQDAGGEFRFGVDEEFIAQLTAEKEITKHKHGVAYKEWIQTRSRNEISDLMNYALAALRLARPNWEQLAQQLHPKRKPEAAASAPAKPAWIPKRESWLRGRR